MDGIGWAEGRIPLNYWFLSLYLSHKFNTKFHQIQIFKQNVKWKFILGGLDYARTSITLEYTRFQDLRLQFRLHRETKRPVISITCNLDDSITVISIL